MKQFARTTGGILSLIVILGSIYGIFHRQEILDYLALRNYVPSERVVQLADQTTMQDSTRRVFYINHPKLDTKTDFRSHCPTSEQSIVLGCYIQRNGIYLLDVNDERLSGVVQVTAAHESLHAEYDRLSSNEQSRVDQMTASAFANLKNDRIKKTVEQYRSKDPSVVPNELHSILATEVRSLPPELEAYYSQYFKDRGQIVNYSEKYEQTFVDLNTQVDKYDNQLKELKATIESNQVEIEGLGKDIEMQKSRLDALINSGKTEQYNAAVPEFNAQVNGYNNLIARTRSLISQYNAIVEKRNAIATTEQELVEAINSNTLPKQTQ
jgi:uncharacterized protein YukE